MSFVTDNLPSRKVTASTLAAALATITVWILNTFVLPKDQRVPDAVTAALTTIFTFVAGYFTPNAGIWERMRKALQDPNWDWRTVDRLAAIAGVSVDDALAILQNRPDVIFDTNAAGQTIARLR